VSFLEGLGLLGGGVGMGGWGTFFFNIEVIAANLSHTEIPFPLFEFSPGLIIQIFLGYLELFSISLIYESRSL